MRLVKKLPSNVQYLYSTVDPSSDVPVKLYRNSAGSVIYLCFFDKIFSLDKKSLSELSIKIYSYVKESKLSDVKE